MKKLITPLLIATQLGGATPQLSSAKTPFNPDSAARRMLIYDAVDGKLNIKTVEKAYGMYSKNDDLERAMWLALMKDPTLLEWYMSEGMRKKVVVAYNEDALATNLAYNAMTFIMFFGTLGLWSWVEYKNKQMIINPNGK
ncbi:MAG: hypothetical protein ACPL06_02895 [Candidatus Anstonellales archaeon]